MVLRYIIQKLKKLYNTEENKPLDDMEYYHGLVDKKLRRAITPDESIELYKLNKKLDDEEEREGEPPYVAFYDKLKKENIRIMSALEKKINELGEEIKKL